MKSRKSHIRIAGVTGVKRVASVLLVALVTSSLGLFGGCKGRSNESITPPYSKLVGKWVRPDGGYVLEIKSVDVAGVMSAAYFNPNPIHVAKAQASRDNTDTKVFIELRDVNYPGATYTLTYQSELDQLVGLYYQPLSGQTYEIAFLREKP
jgi:uncharacterized protein (DUF2147 family)